MWRRRAHVALLSFTGLWFGIIVPGHERGQVTLPGSECAADGAPAPRDATCPCAHADVSPVNDAPSDPDTPQPRPTGRCAVCQFIATLQNPGPVVIHTPELGLLALKPWSPSTRRTALGVMIARRDRAPPSPSEA